MPKKDPAKRARAKLELDRFTYQRWDNDHWLNVAAALNLIAVIRGVDRSQARTFLIEACASDSVQSRYVVSLSSQDLGSLSWRAPTWGDLLGDNNAKAYRGIAPATWQRNDGTIDFVTGAYRYDNPDGRYAGEAVTEINAADLAECLNRPRRGPRPGTVKSLQAEYQALFPTVKSPRSKTSSMKGRRGVHMRQRSNWRYMARCPATARPKTMHGGWRRLI